MALARFCRLWAAVLSTQYLLRSKNQEIFTIQQVKKSLCALDDKRYIVDGTHDTLPWGHYAARVD